MGLGFSRIAETAGDLQKMTWSSMVARQAGDAFALEPLSPMDRF
jgi:hypothetical protein